MYKNNVPFIILVFITFIILLPGLLDLLFPTKFFQEIWLLYIIPVLIVPYYLGLKGGIATVLVETAIQTIVGIIKFTFYDINIQSRVMNHISLIFITFITAFIVGALFEKLAQNNKELTKKIYILEQLYKTDELTGLLNRRGFYEEFMNLKEKTQSILFLDLDDFKLINDKYGHKFGDLLLKKVANVLSVFIEGKGTLARIGGDEFIILYQEKQRQIVENNTKELLELLENSITVNDIKIPVTASIGIYCNINSTEDIDSILIKADTALYEAKGKGKNCYHFFNHQI